jgi:hypothetical protein
LTSASQAVLCAALNLEHYMRVLTSPTNMQEM